MRRASLFLLFVLAGVLIAPAMPASAQYEFPACPNRINIRQLLPNESTTVSFVANFFILAGQADTGNANRFPGIQDGGGELPIWPAARNYFGSSVTFTNTDQGRVRTFYYCYGQIAPTSTPLPTATGTPIPSSTATPTGTATVTTSPTATGTPSPDFVCPQPTNGVILYSRYYTVGTYNFMTGASNVETVTFPVDMSIYSSVQFAVGIPSGVTNFLRHYMRSAISGVTGSFDAAMWTTGNAISPMWPFPAQIFTAFNIPAPGNEIANHEFRYFVDIADPGWVQQPSGPVPICLVGIPRVIPTASPTTPIFPTNTLAPPTATRTATATATATATTTSTPTITPTPTIGTLGCAGTEYRIPVAPATTEIPLTTGAQIAVADATVYVNLPGIAQPLLPGAQTWGGPSGLFVVYSVSLEARLVVCLSTPATAVPTFVSTATPAGPPDIGGPPPCVAVAPTPTTIAFTMPELAIVVPTLRPLGSPTPTGTVTTVAISTTAIVGFFATIEAGISTPAASIATASAGYTWQAGANVAATSVVVAQPALEWMSVLNPQSVAWQLQGGPLWALAPLIGPVMPIVVFILVVVLIRFALWMANWILKLVDLVIKLIELIPGM